MRSAKVRRAKLYFLRDLKGKAARMREGGEVKGRGFTSIDDLHDGSRLGDAHARERPAAAGILSSVRRRRGGPRLPGRARRRRRRRAPSGPAHSPSERFEDGAALPSARSSSSKSHRARLRGRSPKRRPTEIDTINIHQASLQAMRRAVMSLAPLPDLVLVDAFRIPDLMIAQRGVVHGDQRCSAIAAASIVAKVTRDRQMRQLHALDPRYGFDRHKGYATADHLAAVKQFGYSAVHRRSFSPPDAAAGI